jgi:hypothetical protein
LEWKRRTPREQFLHPEITARKLLCVAGTPRRYLDLDLPLSNCAAISALLSKGEYSMRKLLLTAVAFGGLTALAASGASAAPSATGVHVAPSHPMVTHVDYYWNHRHWHHRHWEHNHWHYWD